MNVSGDIATEPTSFVAAVRHSFAQFSTISFPINEPSFPKLDGRADPSSVDLFL